MPPVFLWSCGLQSTWGVTLAEEALGGDAAEGELDVVAESAATTAPVVAAAWVTPAGVLVLAGSRPTDR